MSSQASSQGGSKPPSSEFAAFSLLGSGWVQCPPLYNQSLVARVMQGSDWPGQGSACPWMMAGPAALVVPGPRRLSGSSRRRRGV